jgi:hypothetical protein
MPTTYLSSAVNQIGNAWTQTASSSVITPTIPAGTAVTVLQVETNSIRVSEDPANPPTVANGLLVQAGQSFYSYNPGRLRFIRNGASDATYQLAHYN